MRIALGCDHAGFALKQAITPALEAEGHSVLDLGTFSAEPVDYPDFARSVGQAVLKGFVEAGILICGTGVGMAMAANKMRGVRAAYCRDAETARQSRAELDANVLCLGGRGIGDAAAVEIVRAWLNTSFSAEERHVRRLGKIEQFEGAAAAERPAAPAPVRSAAPAAAAPAPARPAPAAAPAAPVAAPPLPPVPPTPAPVARPTPAAPAPATAAAAAGRAAPPPPPPPPPPAPIERPRPRPMQSSLAAEAEALFQQYKGKDDEAEEAAGGAKREGVISLDDALEDLVESRPRPKPPEARAKPPEARPATPTAPPAPARAAPPPSRPEPTPEPPKAPPTPAGPPPPPDAQRAPEVDEVIAALERDDLLGRLWTRDVTLWPGDATAVRNRLGWLTAPAIMREQADEMKGFADEIRRLSFTHVVLLGMGGSSLASEVFNSTFGSKMGYPDLLLLDSTDPGAIKRTLDRISPQRSIFLVSTKSGDTAETMALYQYFRSQVEQGRPSKPGMHFVAITDGGSPLEKIAQDTAFRRVFLNPPTVGGRYSALTYFGLVPAALMGVDTRGLLERAHAMMESCGPDVAASDNPAIRLGAALAAFARAGRDKVTFVLSEKLGGLGAWIEQLLAESLGKSGKGVVPVDGEPLGAPAVYGDDRLFVTILLDGDHTHDAAIAAVAKAGHPVVRVVVKEPLDLGAEFFRWELATAVAGAVLEVNPFDEPDVAGAKQRTADLLAAWRKSRKLPEWPVAVETDGIALATGSDAKYVSLTEGLAQHLVQLRPGDYVGIHAYLTPLPDTGKALQEMRVAIRDHHKVATTVAYGPRFLHSTGQLHKGGPPTGVFLQLTCDDAEDTPIPGAGHGFGTLKTAQALGDLEALRAAGQRVIRLHLKGRTPQAADKLAQAIRAACRKG